MEILIYLSLGVCLLGVLLALDGTSNKKLDRKIKGKNVTMPDPSKLMFWGKKKRR
jgi:hypothetical protein